MERSNSVNQSKNYIIVFFLALNSRSRLTAWIRAVSLVIMRLLIQLRKCNGPAIGLLVVHVYNEELGLSEL